MNMLKAKRMSAFEYFGGHSVKDIKGFKKIMAKAQELEDARISTKSEET